MFLDREQDLDAVENYGLRDSVQAPVFWLNRVDMRLNFFCSSNLDRIWLDLNSGINESRKFLIMGRDFKFWRNWSVICFCPFLALDDTCGASYILRLTVTFLKICDGKVVFAANSDVFEDWRHDVVRGYFINILRLDGDKELVERSLPVGPRSPGRENLRLSGL